MVFFAERALGMKFHSMPHNIGRADVGSGNGFARTTSPISTILLMRFSKSHDSHFVDLGCGDGIALLLAKLSGFKDICGVELDPELAALSTSNFRTSCIHKGDMASPDTLQHLANVERPYIYLFNPAPDDVVAKAIAQIITGSEAATLLLRNANQSIDAIKSSSPGHDFHVAKQIRNHTLLIANQKCGLD